MRGHKIIDTRSINTSPSEASSNNAFDGSELVSAEGWRSSAGAVVHSASPDRTPPIISSSGIAANTASLAIENIAHSRVSEITTSGHSLECSLGKSHTSPKTCSETFRLQCVSRHDLTKPCAVSFCETVYSIVISSN
jgi:hypothetical protein